MTNEPSVEAMMVPSAEERVQFVRNLVDEIRHQRISIGTAEAIVEKFYQDGALAERERCIQAINSVENKLWGGQRQIGYDAAKEDAIKAIENGEPKR